MSVACVFVERGTSCPFKNSTATSKGGSPRPGERDSNIQPFRGDLPGRGWHPAMARGSTEDSASGVGGRTRVDEAPWAWVPAVGPTVTVFWRGAPVASQCREDLAVVGAVLRHFDIKVGNCSNYWSHVERRHRLRARDALGPARV